MSQWADEERRLSPESSAEPGRWYTDRAPYLREIMDTVNDPAIFETWVQKSAQVGWTETLNNIVGYFIDQDPSPILLVQPTVDLGKAWSKERLAPMIRDTPCLTSKVADSRERDSENTVLGKKYPGGQLTIAGANSAAGLASRPKRVILCDEVDKYPANAGGTKGAGDPINLAKKRAQTYWNRKFLGGSTPKIKGTSRIEEGFESGDRRYYQVPCPHCKEFQRLVWAQVWWPDDNPRAAVYRCQHCGTHIDESHKQQMLAAGKWVATRPFHGIASFHISELYSPWGTWGDMAVAFKAASKQPETLQTFINESLGETWVDKGATPEPEGLLARRESYTAASLPAGVLLLTIGTDVQKDRIEVKVLGWGEDEECWRVEHIVLRGDPSRAALWAEHDAILRRRYTTDDGRELVIEAGCVDSGGMYTQHVYAYCHRRTRNRIFAIKGKEGVGRLVWPKQATKTKTRAVVWVIGVDTIKDVVYGRLNAIEKPGPGYMHFDASTDQEALNQLTSEVVVYKNVRGRKVKQFKPKTTEVAQEDLDCTVYGYAAMIARGGSELLMQRRNALSKKRKAEAEESGEPVAEQQPQDTEPAPAAAPHLTAAPSQEGAGEATTAPEQPKQEQQQKPRRVRQRTRSKFISNW